MQLFQNLIGNAIKYHGTSSPVVHISAKQRKNEWLFAVTDNGIGIEPEHHQTISVCLSGFTGERFPARALALRSVSAWSSATVGLAVENMYHQLGGAITVIVKEGHAHHPHSLQNANPIADWIVQHMQPSAANRPAFVDTTFTKSYYYSLERSFIYLKEEQTYATARGPGYRP